MKELSNKRGAIVTGVPEPVLPGCEHHQTKKSTQSRMRGASVYCHATPGFHIKSYHRCYCWALQTPCITEHSSARNKFIY